MKSNGIFTKKLPKINILFTLIFISFIATGCANTIKHRSQVQYWQKPTKNEAMEKINEYLKTHLIDPYSAIVECSEPTEEAWIWAGVGYETQYGYLVICQVNAKNRFGGYVGAKNYIFRFNGKEFEYHEIVPRLGLMNNQ